jgi:predicted branched-subunit amino acid permease
MILLGAAVVTGRVTTGGVRWRKLTIWPRPQLTVMTPTDIPPSAPVTLTLQGVRRGALVALPFCASSVIYGLAFGLLAAGVGLSTAEAVAMSVLVFSGSAQVAVVQAWSNQTSLLLVFVTVFVANVRYVLMGAALRSSLAPLGFMKASLALLPLVDGSFALGFRARARGDYDAGVMVGSGFISYLGWVIGTGFGAAASRLIANPRALGLDFIIVAFCAASATALLRGRADFWPVLAAVAAVVVCEYFALGPITVIVGGLVGAVCAALLYVPPAKVSAL